MALDVIDIAEGTAAAVALAVATQAVEDRAPTTAQADQYSALVSGGGAALGLVLMHMNTDGRNGDGAFEVGKALWYGGTTLLTAEGTRYVDHRLAASAAAAANAANAARTPPAAEPPAQHPVAADAAAYMD